MQSKRIHIYKEKIHDVSEINAELTLIVLKHHGRLISSLKIVIAFEQASPFVINHCVYDVDILPMLLAT